MLTQERLKEVLHYEPETGVFTWRVNLGRIIKAGTMAKSRTGDGYIKIGLDSKPYLAHRLAWLYTHGEWPRKNIDHINGVRDDNRLNNLRDINQTENLQNQRSPRSNNKAGYLGVSLNRGAYTALIQVDGKERNLGRYKTPEEASAAYLKAKRELHPACSI